jgi:hypothetical protein
MLWWPGPAQGIHEYPNEGPRSQIVSRQLSAGVFHEIATSFMIEKTGKPASEPKIAPATAWLLEAVHNQFPGDKPGTASIM